jgi:hypothetical protein
VEEHREEPPPPDHEEPAHQYFIKESRIYSAMGCIVVSVRGERSGGVESKEDKCFKRVQLILSGREGEEVVVFLACAAHYSRFCCLAMAWQLAIGVAGEVILSQDCSLLRTTFSNGYVHAFVTTASAAAFCCGTITWRV